MTIQQFANGEFDEQKVNRHEVRQVLRNVRKFTPEDWVEARRQRAEARNGQTGATEVAKAESAGAGRAVDESSAGSRD